MIKRANNVIFGLFVSVTSFVLHSCETEPMTVTTFQVNGGYGYSIKHQGRILIKQENIPAIAKVQAFCTQEDAEKTGELVKDKILNHLSPSLSLEELKKLEVNLDCKRN